MNMCTHFCNIDERKKQKQNKKTSLTYEEHLLLLFQITMKMFAISFCLHSFLLIQMHTYTFDIVAKSRCPACREYSIAHRLFIENMFPSIFRTLHFILFYTAWTISWLKCVSEWMCVELWLCGAADRIRLPIRCMHVRFIVSPPFFYHTSHTYAADLATCNRRKEMYRI